MFMMRDADGVEYGPVTGEQLKRWLLEGRAVSGTLIQEIGSRDWKPLSDYPDFAGQLGPSAPPPQITTPPPQASPRKRPVPPPFKPRFEEPDPPPDDFETIETRRHSPVVSSYLFPSILCTLCCSQPVPLGIVAIVYAILVHTRSSSGDYVGAQSASDKARMWCWIAFGSGLVFSLIGLGPLRWILFR